MPTAPKENVLRRMKLTKTLILLAASLLAGLVTPPARSADRDALIGTALGNGEQAHEALARSRRVMEAWMARRDSVTGLLPRTGKVPAWFVRDSAADLFPFLAMAAYYTDRPRFETDMLEVFRQELQWSGRLGALSDNVKPGGGFVDEEADLDRMIFGSCEYAKDGLLPLTELFGDGPWCARLRSIADSMIEHAPYETPYGRVPSLSAEVNGEFLQVLSRLAHRTRDETYTKQAVAIGDFYFKEVLPRSNGLPPHRWDLDKRRPAETRFNLSDHGNEILGGLSELVLFLKETEHPRYAEFKEPFTKLVDRVLKVGRNEDGVWYLAVSLEDGSVLDRRHAHCWGYLFNGVYTAYLITGEERFKEATLNALDAVFEKTTYLDDPAGSGRGYGSNAYSDALESAIVFLNRFPNPEREAILDTCVKRFLARQRDNGIIEDWYGDGNYVRTALTYALMKSQGAWLEPWRKDVRLGAVRDGDAVLLAVSADKPWRGRIRFDRPRHREHFNLPVNYPRLNEFPEWFTVEQDGLYSVRIGEGEPVVRSGAELVRGLAVEVREEGVLPLFLKRRTKE